MSGRYETKVLFRAKMVILEMMSTQFSGLPMGVGKRLKRPVMKKDLKC